MESFLICLVALAAFFLKGVTGTGTTTVIVALGSLFIDPKLTIVLASFINVFGGLSMVRIDPVPLPRRYWCPISLLMVAGSVAGAMALKQIPNQQFQLILGSAFLLTALWFLFHAPAPRNRRDIPSAAGGLDLGVGAAAGFCGGFIGINAPPLILHFSRTFHRISETMFRRTLGLFLVFVSIRLILKGVATLG